MCARDGISKLTSKQIMMEKSLPVTGAMCRFLGKGLACRYDLVLKTK